MLIGIVGKPSSGKSTFLNAISPSSDAKTGDYPFTTIQPNRGTGFLRTECVCKDYDVEDNPRNSTCEDGVRLVPFQLLDVAGLVPGASEGKGMGNQFLDDLRQANLLIHVVDLSGSLDSEGVPAEKGSYDPEQDILFLEEEIDQWIYNILMKDWDRLSRKMESQRANQSQIAETLAVEKLSGLQFTKNQIYKAILETDFESENPRLWSEEELRQLIKRIREIGKPIVIAGNKIDQPKAYENYERLKEKYDIVPCSALTEFILIKKAEKGEIKYIPGGDKLEIIELENEKEKVILDQIEEKILKKYGSTGVQPVVDHAIKDVLNMIVAYPVEDHNKLTDNDGRVLPDVFMIEKGTTAKKFAGMIHSDFEETFTHGILAKTGQRIGADHEIEDRDVIKIVAATRKK
ncbi:MAG: redox-regulated ATPase YchF [Candidatus Kariarchaeaceae archaeon]